MKTSILIAEEDALLRSLLADILSANEDFHVAAQVGSGQDVLEAVEELRPRVLLLDVTMTDQNGLAVVEHVALMEDAPMVLVLSSAESEDMQLEAARHGAHGYISKSQGVGVIPTAIRAIAGGEVWFTRQIVGRMFREYADLQRRVREFERPANQLSEREYEVLLRVARGMTNQQIAHELNMSVSTVKVHVRGILQKFDLPNRTEAAVFAVREGLLQQQAASDLRPRVRS